MSAYLVGLLEKHLIIFTQGDTKDNGCHILETMDPFLAFTPLAAHIEHAGGRLALSIVQPFSRAVY